ncbi:hypothetical protein JMN32_20010 [Fulvivirga sp. 29W222]|uniref:Uncharacterized protein n=1 Tax=Fulvivirga marina TaxID=2494733 RepID=A0A937KDH2_9BACT|nr:hypothetical protein [Fulvivirga marina]MBL6448607.1 hypothetical protein [Fulvivirga marina]
MNQLRIDRLKQAQAAIYRSSSAKKQRDNNTLWDYFLKLLPILVSIAGVVMGLFQYSYNQYVQDVRKYNLSYYDERFAILKNMAGILSRIDTEISINPKGRSEAQQDSLINLVKELNQSQYYAYLYLDPADTTSDLKLINSLDICSQHLNNMLIGFPVSKEDFRESSLNSMRIIGDILRKEKDEVNTFNYGAFIDELL